MAIAKDGKPVKPAKDYAADVKRYAPGANEGAIAAIVKHCGIALQSADASMVSCSSKDEMARVRENWLKKKLGLTESDEVLDKALQEICAKMKADRGKSRVTFYYLLAEKYGKLDGLLKKTATA